MLQRLYFLKLVVLQRKYKRIVIISDSNITIYYTTNGDSPDNNSAVYNTPISINNTTVLKAVAYSSNTSIPSSFIDYHTFFINDNHTIPILSISGDSVDMLIEDGVLSTGGGWWGGTSLELEGPLSGLIKMEC